MRLPIIAILCPILSLWPYLTWNWNAHISKKWSFNFNGGVSTNTFYCALRYKGSHIPSREIHKILIPHVPSSHTFPLNENPISLYPPLLLYSRNISYYLKNRTFFCAFKKNMPIFKCLKSRQPT